jgi:hypothetical protein
MDNKSWKSRHILIFCAALIVEVWLLWLAKLTGAEFVELFKWTLIALAGGHGWSKMADK